MILLIFIIFRATNFVHELFTHVIKNNQRSGQNLPRLNNNQGEQKTIVPFDQIFSVFHNCKKVNIAVSE